MAKLKKILKSKSVGLLICLSCVVVLSILLSAMAADSSQDVTFSIVITEGVSDGANICCCVGSNIVVDISACLTNNPAVYSEATNNLLRYEWKLENIVPDGSDEYFDLPEVNSTENTLELKKEANSGAYTVDVVFNAIYKSDNKVVATGTLPLSFHVIEVKDVTFDPAPIPVDPDGEGEGESTTTASATIIPECRTITWSIEGDDDLGCSIDEDGVITAGSKGGVLTVRASDSVLSECYAEGTLDVIKIEFTKDEDMVVWSEDGYDAKSMLSEDTHDKSNIDWTVEMIDDVPHISGDGVVTFVEGEHGGKCKVIATSMAGESPVQSDEMIVTVIKLDVIPDEMEEDQNTIAIFRLAHDRYVPSGVEWELSPQEENGAYVSYIGNYSIQINTGTKAGEYSVKATSVDISSYSDTSTLIVKEVTCTPGERIDVTLTEGEPPFDESHHAWSVPANYWAKYVADVLSFLNEFGTTDWQSQFGKYDTYYRKRYIDECCPDSVEGDWGEYRLESTTSIGQKSINWSGSFNILDFYMAEPEWLDVLDKSIFVVKKLSGKKQEEEWPIEKVTSFVSMFFSTLKSFFPHADVDVRLGNETYDRTVKESDECNGCLPDIINSCWTGHIRTKGFATVDGKASEATDNVISVLEPTFGEGIAFLVNELCQIRLSYGKLKEIGKTGSRVGLNNKIISYDLSIDVKYYKVPYMRAVRKEERIYNPIEVNVPLCM